MNSNIREWGNSLAIRIPQALAIEAGLEKDTEIELSVVNGKLIIERTPKYTLEELLAGVTPENLHGETDTGDPVGNEIW